MQVQEKPFWTEAVLLERLGAAPTVSRVARFLEEDNSTTWRRLKEGYLKAIDGNGTTRITLQSLAALLNGGADYQVTHKRGRKPAKSQEVVEA